MLRAVLKRIPGVARGARFLRALRFRTLSPRARFEEIYRKQSWGNPRESLSGSGSSLDKTQAIRASLPGLLSDLDVKSLLDVPCGDFYWMQAVDLGQVRYLGGDIVPDVIRTNALRYASAHRRFFEVDLVRDPLPQADLVLCRDCLVHLSHGDALAALANIRKSGSRYLLATTFPAVTRNRDILTGNWRPINLCAAPFEMKQPLLTIHEHDGKHLGLWAL